MTPPVLQQYEEDVCENGEATTMDSDEVKHAKSLEVEAVKMAEEGDLEKAASLLTEAITIAPSYPSPYNNRAQV